MLDDLMRAAVAHRPPRRARSPSSIDRLHCDARLRRGSRRRSGEGDVAAPPGPPPGQRDPHGRRPSRDRLAERGARTGSPPTSRTPGSCSRARCRPPGAARAARSRWPADGCSWRCSCATTRPARAEAPIYRRRRDYRLAQPHPAGSGAELDQASWSTHRLETGSGRENAPSWPAGRFRVTEDLPVCMRKWEFARRLWIRSIRRHAGCVLISAILPDSFIPHGCNFSCTCNCTEICGRGHSDRIPAGAAQTGVTGFRRFGERRGPCPRRGRTGGPAPARRRVGLDHGVDDQLGGEVQDVDVGRVLLPLGLARSAPAPPASSIAWIWL